MHEHRIVYEEVPGSRTSQQPADQPHRERIAYEELQPGDIIQPGDEFCVSIGQDRWQPYPTRRDGSRVSASSLARRPIGKTHQTVHEEVSGSRTTQDTVVQPQRERIAYEDLQPGDIIQEGDEWQHESGRWKPFASLDGSCVQVRHTQRARRPHNITMMLREFASQAEALAEVREAVTQLQDERDEACRERDLARSEVARLSTELWARRPLEERVASLLEELANAREDFRKLVKTNAENADQFAEHTATLVRQRDGFDAELQRLQEVVGNLYSEPTARQVQDMLRTWATELDWSAGCFGAFGRSQIDIIQQTMIAVIQRIEGMVNPEGGSDDN